MRLCGADQGAPDDSESAGQVALDHVGGDADGAKPASSECFVTEPVDVLLAEVDGTVDFNDEPVGRSKEVYDERAENDLSPEAYAETRRAAAPARGWPPTESP